MGHPQVRLLGCVTTQTQEGGASPAPTSGEEARLFGGPVGGFVVAGCCELVGLGAVGQHGPDLARAGAGGFEDEVAAVGSPAGTFVAAGVAGELEDVARADVDYVDVVIAGGAAPTEGEEL